MTSENDHIRFEYDQLRRKIAKVLKRTYYVRKATPADSEMRLKRLLNLKTNVKENDVLINGRLDKLIRDGLITSEMATSLANDSDNVAGISKNLIRVAELLYIHADTMSIGITELPSSSNDTNEDNQNF
jgi:phosphate:Na+ symporter